MLHNVAAVFRLLITCSVVAGAALASACSSKLTQQPGSVDANPLQLIMPPPCDQPATPSDGTGDCTGMPGGKPGDDCMTCHHQGGVASPFTFAGTVYIDEAGTMPLAGATIYVADTSGNMITAISHANGNFYGIDEVMYPARTFASLCPAKTDSMMAAIDATMGANCNNAACHSAAFRVYHNPNM